MTDKHTSDFVKRDRERKAAARMARLYTLDPRMAGKPFRFGSSYRQYVTDPDTGAVMSLEKWNARQARKAEAERRRKEGSITGS